MHYVYVEIEYSEWQALCRALALNDLNAGDLTLGQIDHLVAARRAYKAGFYQS